MSQAENPAPTVTVDGPTASGKGAVAQRVAQALNWHYLDSGALYRLVALMAARNDCKLNDEPALAQIARNLDVVFSADRIMLGNEDLSLAIREPSVGNTASRIAVFPAVRDGLMARQRAFRRPPGLVADGRDMATVVFPDAPLKIFLTASVNVRAERRHKQLIEKGFSPNITALRKDLEARDARDTDRPVAPLKPTEDSRTIDSSDLTLEDVVQAVLSMVREAGLEH